jgi:hypothetical protein
MHSTVSNISFKKNYGINGKEFLKLKLDISLISYTTQYTRDGRETSQNVSPVRKLPCGVLSLLSQQLRIVKLT